jgi:ribosomal protein L1
MNAIDFQKRQNRLRTELILPTGIIFYHNVIVLGGLRLGSTLVYIAEMITL